tara:strand:- start:1095 stop:1232 length:138 start_codon:yes stop_codon:yes gene_type:complete
MSAAEQRLFTDNQQVDLTGYAKNHDKSNPVLYSSGEEDNFDTQNT